jgi:hypothetical protein
MAWSGSDILYIISEEMLCSEGTLGGRRSPWSFSRYGCGLSRLGSEDQAGLSFEEFARGIRRSSVKKSC